MAFLKDLSYSRPAANPNINSSLAFRDSPPLPTQPCIMFTLKLFICFHGWKITDSGCGSQTGLLWQLDSHQDTDSWALHRSDHSLARKARSGRKRLIPDFVFSQGPAEVRSTEEQTPPCAAG